MYHLLCAIHQSTPSFLYVAVWLVRKSFEGMGRSDNWQYQCEYENTENGIEENSFEGNSSI